MMKKAELDFPISVFLIVVIVITASVVLFVFVRFQISMFPVAYNLEIEFPESTSQTLNDIDGFVYSIDETPILKINNNENLTITKIEIDDTNQDFWEENNQTLVFLDTVIRIKQNGETKRIKIYFNTSEGVERYEEKNYEVVAGTSEFALQKAENSEKLADEANTISKEANELAKKANNHSWWAIGLSVIIPVVLFILDKFLLEKKRFKRRKRK